MTLIEQLNIKHPIFLAPMAGVSTPELAAEVSNQGGLGSLGLGAHTVDAAREQILRTQELTDFPFQTNFFCHETSPLDEVAAQAWISYFEPIFERYGATAPSQLNCIYPSFKDHDGYLDLVLETKPQAVSFHFGIPHAHQIQALKDAGIITMVSAPNLAEAQAIEAAGIDIIIAQGIEAGPGQRARCADHRPVGDRLCRPCLRHAGRRNVRTDGRAGRQYRAHPGGAGCQRRAICRGAHRRSWRP